MEFFVLCGFGVFFLPYRHSLVIRNVFVNVFHIYLCPIIVTVSVSMYSQIRCGCISGVLSWVFLKFSLMGTCSATWHLLRVLFSLCSAKGVFLPFSVFGFSPSSQRGCSRAFGLLRGGFRRCLSTVQAPALAVTTVASNTERVANSE